MRFIKHDGTTRNIANGGGCGSFKLSAPHQS